MEKTRAFKLNMQLVIVATLLPRKMPHLSLFWPYGQENKKCHSAPKQTKIK